LRDGGLHLASSPLHGSIEINKCVLHPRCIGNKDATQCAVGRDLDEVVDLYLFVLLNWVSKLRCKKGRERSTNHSHPNVSFLREREGRSLGQLRAFVMGGPSGFWHNMTTNLMLLRLRKCSANLQTPTVPYLHKVPPLQYLQSFHHSFVTQALRLPKKLSRLEGTTSSQASQK
jgi:hypothetical protein